VREQEIKDSAAELYLARIRRFFRRERAERITPFATDLEIFQVLIEV